MSRMRGGMGGVVINVASMAGSHGNEIRSKMFELHELFPSYRLIIINKFHIFLK